MMTDQNLSQGSKQSEIMTLTEISKYLKVSEKTIIRMVQAGKLPGTKVARQWRFVRAAIDDWLNSRMYALPKKNLVQVIATADHVIPITRLVPSSQIIMDLKPGTKESVLSQLVLPLYKAGIITNADTYAALLNDRESLVSTAIGHGFAIPHARNPEESDIATPCMVIGICKEGTDFEALDGRKTYVFAMPCTHSESSHLRLVAKISLIFRKPGVMRRMKKATSTADVASILAEVDADLQSIL